MKDREPAHSERKSRSEHEPTPKARFDMGQIVVTVGADITLAEIERHPVQLLARHVAGDWGDLPEHDINENERSLKRGAVGCFRLMTLIMQILDST
jgi:hypothetical protein